MRKNVQTLVIRTVCFCMGLCFFGGLAHANPPVDLLWDDFDDFPGHYWTVLSGDWEQDAGRVLAGHDLWDEGYWAISHTGVGEWPSNYYIWMTHVSFEGEVTGQVTIFFKLNGNLQGYALSLDGDNDRVLLWKAWIHDDGRVESLGPLAEVLDFGFVADQRYSVHIDHRNSVNLTCSVDGELVADIRETTYRSGGVAIGYQGAGRGAFDEMTVTLWTWLCFVAASGALDTVRGLLDGIDRWFLLLPLMLIGLAGIACERRSRIGWRVRK